MALNSSQIVVRYGSIVASHLSQIVVSHGSTLSPSIQTIGSGEPAIIGAPPSQLVNLVTPSTAMTKASSFDIETTNTIPRDKIRRKTSRRLQKHNAEKRDLKKRADGAFITATQWLREEKTKDNDERKTARSIVDEINIMHETSLNEITVSL